MWRINITNMKQILNAQSKGNSFSKCRLQTLYKITQFSNNFNSTKIRHLQHLRTGVTGVFKHSLANVVLQGTETALQGQTFKCCQNNIIVSTQKLTVQTLLQECLPFPVSY